MSNCKNIAKPSKKIEPDWEPLLEFKMGIMMKMKVLWPIYSNVWPLCSTVTNTGKLFSTLCFDKKYVKTLEGEEIVKDFWNCWVRCLGDHDENERFVANILKCVASMLHSNEYFQRWLNLTQKFFIKSKMCQIISWTCQ